MSKKSILKNSNKDLNKTGGLNSLSFNKKRGVKMSRKPSSEGDIVFKDPDVQKAYERLRDVVKKNGINIKKLFL